MFGSNVSSPCWEPFRRAIEGLTVKFANRPDLVVKHKKYIDMIKWELPVGNQPTPTRAVKCVLNPGILNSLGDKISHPARTLVDDALIAALGVAVNENGTGSRDRGNFCGAGQT